VHKGIFTVWVNEQGVHITSRYTAGSVLIPQWLTQNASINIYLYPRASLAMVGLAFDMQNFAGVGNLCRPIPTFKGGNFKKLSQG